MYSTYCTNYNYSQSEKCVMIFIYDNYSIHVSVDNIKFCNILYIPVYMSFDVYKIHVQCTMYMYMYTVILIMIVHVIYKVFSSNHSTCTCCIIVLYHISDYNFFLYLFYM